MLTLYHRTRLTYYESNYDIYMDEEEISASGKKAVPDDGSWRDDITISQSGEESKFGRPSLTMDARASITYQYDRCFLTVSGQLNNYHNTVDDHKLRLTDWYVNAALGVRF